MGEEAEPSIPILRAKRKQPIALWIQSLFWEDEKKAPIELVVPYAKLLLSLSICGRERTIRSLRIVGV